MRNPVDQAVRFVFASHPAKLLPLRWRAELVFPAGALGESELPLTVTDGTGAKVAEGVLEIAGRKLAVTDGAATIRFADFVAGKHETSLWLHRPGQPPVPGGLTFE